MAETPERQRRSGAADGVAAEDPRVTRTRQDVLAAVIDVLIDEGWDAVTHPHVARVAGYSKATVYAHWPERIDLLRDALARFGEMPHHEPTGDLRSDLIGELRSFRRALVDHRLDRVLAILAERASADPEFISLRDAFVAEGEAPLRSTLVALGDGPEVEAAVMMLCGLALHPMLMHGAAPSDAAIEAGVDMVLAALGR
jgi:AcrR family transcriptional regulator